MVYGRYNELVFMGFINQLVTGGHHPVGEIKKGHSDIQLRIWSLELERSEDWEITPQIVAIVKWTKNDNSSYVMENISFQSEPVCSATVISDR